MHGDLQQLNSRIIPAAVLPSDLPTPFLPGGSSLFANVGQL